MAQKKKKGKNVQVEMVVEGDGMQPTTIRLPATLWEALDKDAERCKRNRSRQLEALLEAFYFGVNADMSLDRLQEMAKASSFELTDDTKAQPKAPYPERHEDRN